jgi:hypothetical protein
MKALWYFSMSVLPSMSYGNVEETSATGGSATSAQPSPEFHLVELDVDESSNACRGGGESGDNFASDTLGGVAVGSLDAVVERAAVGYQIRRCQFQLSRRLQSANAHSQAAVIKSMWWLVSSSFSNCAGTMR